MEKFDLSKTKYYWMAGFIFFIFVLVIWQAYSYLPADTNEERVFGALNLPGDEEVVEKSDDSSDVERRKERQDRDDIMERHRRNADVDDSDDDRESALEPMNEDDNEQSEDKVSRVKTGTSGDYLKDAADYIAAAEKADEADDKAEYYAEAAKAYASLKRYGTALSYAQKAYNLSPSSEREVLLARLYYKTGEYDKASTRMNNVMKRDFSLDR